MSKRTVALSVFKKDKMFVNIRENMAFIYFLGNKNVCSIIRQGTSGSASQH
jgi:hypothetical protein